MAELTNSKTVQVVDEIEGEPIETNDYFFAKLGDAIPIMSDASVFDVQNPPAKPLAVSGPFGLIFAAHSSGFCVAKTKQVISAAKEIKDKGSGSSVQELSVISAAKEIKDKGSGSSVQELSVVDVPVGRVNILAVSSDSSSLAAVVGNDIHYFSVNSLLHKDKKPFFSCSVETDHVKDLLWAKDVEASVVVLASNGKLLIGGPRKSLEVVAEEVDAVGTSADGKFVAVARKSTLTIFSSKFSEILRISLPLNTWIGDSDTSCTVKVDSIRWVRPDSIVIGCLQATEDGEENYYVQVIKSKENTIIDGSSMLAAIGFSDLFVGIVDDIVPFGCGPHLFTDYLESCELAFVANRKNTDEHIMLLAWSEVEGQVSVVHIERDKLIPRVEYQESGDENLVLGLWIDKTSVYENVIVELGDQERKELPPHCLLICLTLEGRLIMFNVASFAVSQRSTMSSSGVSSDVQHIPVVEPSNLRDTSLISENPNKSAITPGSQEKNANKTNFRFSEVVSAIKDPNSSNVKQTDASTLDLNENWRKESAVGAAEEKASGDVSTSKAEQLEHSSKGTLSQFSLKDSQVKSPASVAGDVGSIEKLRAGRDQPLVKNLPDFSKGITEKSGAEASQSTSASFWSGATSGVSNGKSPLFSTPSTLSGSVVPSANSSNNAGSFFGNLSSHPLDTRGSLTGKIASDSQKAQVSSGIADKPFGTPTSKVQSQASVPLQSPMGNSRFMMKGSIKSFPSGQTSSEQESSKQYSNVEAMANELDKLLECIEEGEGFAYACTSAHRDSLETLEDSMKSLSERCRLSKNLTEERLTEIQLLLDKTVQVLAREKHMEGIVSQTNDHQYWDLWNRQKLSSELDLKRQNVLNRYQDLINQMIELEKHFNTLELSSFGESSAVDTVSRPLTCRSTTSRHIQSLQTVHSATISQLTAAQHLSELLSWQMAALNVKSPPAKQQSLKKQLFESIGLSDTVDYGASATASRKKMIEPSSNSSGIVSSSGATHKESRRNLTSCLGNQDPETARRRRDSLDRNWANFETPRTTVKRVLVEDKGCNVNSSFSSRDNQLVSSFRQEDSITRSKFLATQDRNGSKDMAGKFNSGTVATSIFKWAGPMSETLQAEPERSPRLQQVSQGNNLSSNGNKSATSSPLMLSFSAPFGNPNVKDNNNSIGAQTVHIDKSKPSFVSECPPVQEKSNKLKMQPQLMSSPVKGGDVSVSYSEHATSLTPAAVGGRSPQMGSTHDVQSSAAFGSSLISTFSRSSVTVPAPNTQATSGSTGDDRSASSASGSSLFSTFSRSSSVMIPAPNTQGTSGSTGDDGSASSAKLVKNDNNQIIQSLSSAFSVSSSVADAIKSKDSKALENQSVGSFISTARGPLKEGPKPSAEEVGAETNPESTPQPSQKIEPSTSEGLKFGFSTSSTPANGVPKQEASGSSVAVSTTAAVASDVTQSNTQSEMTSPHMELKTPSLSLPDSGFGGKNVDAAESHEEEMEEEAPETNDTATLSLGGLAGFGIGSSPSVTSSRPNPFGAPATSSPVSLAVPAGELFRPASFSFQSLQPSQQSQPPNVGATTTSGGFGSGSFGQQPPPSGSGFGQPGQIGSGQQALGSVLGSFGQSRQIGGGLPSGGGFGGAAQSGGGFFSASTGVSPPGGGFASIRPTGGGFAAAATGGGFASAATGGGFAAAAAGGGFASAGTGSGGFAAAAGGGGFAAAGSTGAGFGGFSKQGAGGFGGFGAGAPGANKPASDLFTQIRR